MRDIITLACTECKRRNYTTTKNKKKNSRQVGTEKVLPVRPEAYCPQGDKNK